jgi:hypothetical protein
MACPYNRLGAASASRVLLACLMASCCWLWMIACIWPSTHTSCGCCPVSCCCCTCRRSLHGCCPEACTCHRPSDCFWMWQECGMGRVDSAVLGVLLLTFATYCNHSLALGFVADTCRVALCLACLGCVTLAFSLSTCQFWPTQLLSQPCACDSSLRRTRATQA